ncbi:MAG TPA: histidine phosphatase family protein [Dehalococcoidia bacterium]|nr:histidine phosphatase family protein [Dehalococcoidia bacterium]
MTRLILIRHGETEWNQIGLVQGWTDVPLTDKGRRQAAALAAAVEPLRPVVVFSSDSGRAFDTAEIMRNGLVAHGQILPPVLIRKDLREINRGVWEGRNWQEIVAEDPELYRACRTDPAAAPPDGESHNQITARVRRVLGGIAAAYPEQTVVVVTHGRFIWTARLAATGESLSPDVLPVVPNTSWNELIVDGDDWRIGAWAQVAHLSEELHARR